MVEAPALKRRQLIDPVRLRYRARKQLERPLGQAFLSAPGQALWATYLRRVVPTPTPVLRTAVVAHVYYPDLLDEMLACWRNVTPLADLHVTTLAEHADAIAARLPRDARSRVTVHPNRGRDIQPFLAVLNSGALADYDAVLKLHTKRSPQQKNGELRRKLLLATLAGHPLQALRCVRQFNDPSTGIVGWGSMYRRDAVYWYGNTPRVAELCAQMRISSPALPSFFEGSMFWFRPTALEPLRRRQLVAEAFEPEPSALDGQLHHAVERTFNVVAVADGFAIRATAGQLLQAGSPEALRAPASPR